MLTLYTIVLSDVRKHTSFFIRERKAFLVYDLFREDNSNENYITRKVG